MNKHLASLAIYAAAVLAAAAANTNQVVMSEVQIDDATRHNVYVFSSSKTNVVLRFDGGGQSFKPWELPEPFRSTLFTKAELAELKSESAAGPKPKTGALPPAIAPKVDWDRERQSAKVAIVNQMAVNEKQLATLRSRASEARSEAKRLEDRARDLAESAVRNAQLGFDGTGYGAQAQTTQAQANAGFRLAQNIESQLQTLEAQQEALIRQMQRIKSVELEKPQLGGPGFEPVRPNPPRKLGIQNI